MFASIEPVLMAQSHPEHCEAGAKQFNEVWRPDLLKDCVRRPYGTLDVDNILKAR